jgi:predicted  nucleic acid-binding Zn-ribbon protein
VLVQWDIDNMYSVVPKKHVEHSNPKEGKSYKVKYESELLDAVVISIGTRADCIKEMKLRTNKNMLKKEKKIKLSKSNSVKQPLIHNSDSDQLNLFTTEIDILKTKITDLEADLIRERNVITDLNSKIEELNKEIELYKQNYSILILF